MKKRITGTMYLIASTASWYCEAGENYGFYQASYEGSEGDVTVSEKDVTMTVPEDFDEAEINAKFIGALREEQNKIKADAQLKVNNIEERVQSLLALPAPKETT